MKGPSAANLAYYPTSHVTSVNPLREVSGHLVC